MLKNSRAWRRITKKEGRCCPKTGRVTRWERRIDPRPAFHYLAEDDEDEQASRGLNHLVPRNAAGTPWTWKKVIVVVDSREAEIVMLRSMQHEIGIRQTERSKSGKRFKGPGGENIKNHGGRSCTSGPLRDSCARAHGHAGSETRDRKQSSEVRRPPRTQHSHAQVRQRAGDSIVGWGNRTSSPRRKPDCTRETASGESQSNGVIERAVGLVAGEARTLKAALEHRMGTRVPPDARILCWLKDTAAKTTRTKGQRTYSGRLEK